MRLHRGWLIVPALLALAGIGCHEVHLDFDKHESEIVLFDDLYSVSVVDEDHAVAVGYYGTVYWTEDGGESWQRGRTDVLTPLYSVSMANPKEGWVVGQRGLILHTEDGGRNWTRQANLKEKEGSHLFGVTAIDADRALAVGEWGTRIYTEDGGASWHDASFKVDQKHPMFVWLSPEDQEKVRDGGVVYDDVGVNDVQCLGGGSLKCWLVGEFGYIYYSEDGGKTWEKSTIEGSVELEPIKLGYNSLKIGEEQIADLQAFAEGIRDEGHLNVAIEAVASPAEIAEFGGEDDPYPLFETLEARIQEVRIVLEDAGLPTERVRERGRPPWDYEDYLDDDPEFLQRYLDGRKNEFPGVKVRVIQNPVLFTVRFRDEDNGMIAGLGGVILVSRDGGKSWLYRKTDRTQAIFSVDSLPGRAVAVGEKGLVRASVDDGETWSQPSEDDFPSVFTYMRDIDFAGDGKVGFIVGQTGRIMRSTNAGIGWEQVLPPQKEEEEPATSS
jgi:photosystem II stability/assembly factor-like uncharacterized protein